MAIFGYGADEDKDGRVSISESIRDMFNGGGAGRSGSTFEGGLSSISNSFGATPSGSKREPTGIAKVVSGATGIGGRANPFMSAGLGALFGGLPGAAMGLVRSNLDNRRTDKEIVKAGGTVPERPTGLQQLEALFSAKQTPKDATGAASRPAGPAGPVYTTSESRDRDRNRKTALGNTIASVAPKTPTEFAAAGSAMPVLNPDYDPRDPMSSMYVTNPTYERIRGYAEGGEVEAQGQPNEKSIISNAAAAISGDLGEQESAMALGMFVAKYGEDALKDFIERVQSGDLEESAARSEGKLAGPGDGMNDRIPASVSGQKDVLLSDGEFIVPADVVSGLGNGSSDAGAKQLERLMERVRSERTGKSEQPKAMDPAAVLPA